MLEYGALNRFHSFSPHVFAEAKISVRQGHHLTGLTLQNLLNKDPRYAFIQLRSFCLACLDSGLKKGVVSRKNGFGSMDNGADGFVVPKLQEQAEFVHVFWKLFVWPA